MLLVRKQLRWLSLVNESYIQRPGSLKASQGNTMKGLKQPWIDLEIVR